MNSQIVNANKNVASFDFIENGKIITDAPKCYLSLLKAGSMRFRWNEKNQNRENFIQKIQNQNGKIFVPVELNHTKDVYDVKNADDTNEKVGDGIITTNKNLIPCVTVADCVPIYFFDRKTGVFGIVHSGWKGTGIIEKALLLANKNYNSLPSDFSVVIGPHINDCCYIVNKERHVLEQVKACTAWAQKDGVSWFRHFVACLYALLHAVGVGCGYAHGVEEAVQLRLYTE